MLSARDLSFAHPGGKTLLDHVTFQVAEGDRVALVGENGAGKSTLMAVLAGELPPDDGEVHRLKNARVGLLAQTPRLDETLSVLDTVRSGLAELFAHLEEHAALCEQGTPDEAAQARLAELTALIDRQGGFAIEHRVEEVLSRLGVRARNEQVRELSGGERRRVDLARLLLSSPDVLLLDEPTNHLDKGAIDYLAESLRTGGRTVLFVSHDRAFMDDVATSLLELEHGHLYPHDPPYATFVEGRLARHELEGRTLARRARLMAREVAWLRTSPQARTTKSRSRIDRAEALIDEVKARALEQRERVLTVRKSKADRLGRTILELKHLSAGRGDRVFFEGLDLLLTKGERWGIVGPNGAGKTTLLKILLGEVEPLAGEVVRGKNTEIALLDQHRSVLDPDATLGKVVCPEGDYVHVGGERLHVASYLESFLFDPKDRNRKVGTLSGGEQNRLHLALILQRGANCLFLDEPTNDLDVTTLGILEDVLHDHDGVALIVSHDRAFLDRVCTGILAFEPAFGKGAAEHVVRAVQGDYTHYLRLRAEQDAVNSADDLVAVRDEVEAPKAGRAKAKTKRSYKEEKEYQQIEQQVLELEARLEEVQTVLADGSIFVDDAARGQELAAELAELGPRIEKLYLRWQELEDLGG